MRTPSLALTLLLVAAPLTACEVAELPPRVESRDTRDTSGPSDATSASDTGTTSDLVLSDTPTPDAADSSDAADDTDATANPDDADDADGVDAPDPTDTTSSDAPDTTDTTESDNDADDADDAGDTTTTDAAQSDSTACTTTYKTHPIVASPHVTTCSAVAYETDPPTSGPHYPIWAAFKTYTVPINPGFLVHSLEHGAVVITYACPSGCPDELAALTAYLDARPADPLCVVPLRNRYIVAPRANQNTMLAAAAWGASLEADCFDLAALGTFIGDHYARAPENFCNQGVDIETILPENAWYCPPAP